VSDTNPLFNLFLELDTQSTLLGSRLSRLALLKYQPTAAATRAFRLDVLRNHNFEIIESVLSPYLRYLGYELHCNYSDYDDSLSFGDLFSANAHLENHAATLIWLDHARFEKLRVEDYLSFLKQRVARLVEISPQPVLMTGCLDAGSRSAELDEALENFCEALPTVHFCRLEPGGPGPVAMQDKSRQRGTGSRLSGSASLRIAQALGTRWLPALFMQPLKAVIVDLDHTLYHGVLSEEGLGGLNISDSHRALHRHLSALKRQGVMLAVCSKNAEADVLALFDSGRLDIELQDFAVVRASFEPKAASIAMILQEMNIGENATLFVDDNAAELGEVHLALPGVRLLHASVEAAETLHRLQHYPGLFRWKQDSLGSRRTADIQANAQRRQLAASSVSVEDYIAALDMQLVVAVDCIEQLDRVVELCNKTNQFILNYWRPSSANARSALSSTTRHVVTVALQDKLVDSGIVAIIVVDSVEESVEIAEVCISCRALGRNLEGTMILLAVREALGGILDDRDVLIHYKVGSRNDRALKWLGLAESSVSCSDGKVRFSAADFARHCGDYSKHLRLKVLSAN
jgi:FkbH-like protein